MRSNGTSDFKIPHGISACHVTFPRVFLTGYGAFASLFTLGNSITVFIIYTSRYVEVLWREGSSVDIYHDRFLCVQKSCLFSPRWKIDLVKVRNSWVLSSSAQMNDLKCVV